MYTFISFSLKTSLIKGEMLSYLITANLPSVSRILDDNI